MSTDTDDPRGPSELPVASEPSAGEVEPEFTTTAGALELDAELADALAMLDEGLDRLIAVGDRGDLLALGPDRLVGFMRAFEKHRSRLPVVDHAIVDAVDVERLWERTVSRNAAGVIAETLKIPRGEAKARVAAALQYGPTLAMTGESLQPQLAVAAAAQRRGDLTCGQASEIGTAMKHFTTLGVGYEDLRDAEQTLVGHAAVFGPEDLHVIAQKIDAKILPDGRLPKDAITAARRGVTIGQERADGTTPITGDLTPEARVLLFTVLTPLAAPRPSDATGPDTRTAAQRTHDALMDACARLIAHGDLPASGGTPATVHVTIPISGILEAIERAGHVVPGPSRNCGVASDGTRLNLDAVLRLAREADIVPVYLTDTGGILGYGRDKRLFTRPQTDAMIARDKGCTFPTCTAPPEWCERMHITPWYLGGKTDISNGALGCRYHHDHAENHGWQITMIGGLPHWIPPQHLDPQQRPLLNPRVTATAR